MKGIKDQLEISSSKSKLAFGMVSFPAPLAGKSNLSFASISTAATTRDFSGVRIRLDQEKKEALKERRAFMKKMESFSLFILSFGVC